VPAVVVIAKFLIAYCSIFNKNYDIWTNSAYYLIPGKTNEQWVVPEVKLIEQTKNPHYERNPFHSLYKFRLLYLSTDACRTVIVIARVPGGWMGKQNANDVLVLNHQN
jgi:hypothetical protein